MRYKPVYMPHPAPIDDSEWYDTEAAAWDAILEMKCGFGTGELCDMCQAEWSVFSEQEIQEVENDKVQE
jgi:hypothetical protein